MVPTEQAWLLLVEDSSADREMLEHLLRRNGYTGKMTQLNGGATALSFLREFEPTPHLILLDLNLGALGGLEFLKIRGEDPRLKEIPVVVVTGSKSPHDTSRSLRAGADAVLRKTDDLGLFEAAVQHLLEVEFPRLGIAAPHPPAAEAVAEQPRSR